MTDNHNQGDFSDERVSEVEWANRRLCPDGHCIGVIGPDGRCKECGRPGGDAPVGDEDTLPPASSGDSAPDEDLATDLAPQDKGTAAEDDDWDNRRLCPDGNCIGVIGPDGRCKECGRPDETS